MLDKILNTLNVILDYINLFYIALLILLTLTALYYGVTL